MKLCWQPCVLLWLTAALTAKALGRPAADNGKPAKTGEPLQAIPRSNNTSNVTKLVFDASLITLTKEDRLALATYPRLEELHLDGGQVTRIPARYFSVVPQLKVLSLSRNKISSLDVESFSGLDVLTKLDLSHNMLTGLEPRLFSRMNKIEVLNLEGNPWNCSCPLLKVTESAAPPDGGPGGACASLESQPVLDFLKATDECNQATTPNMAKDRPKPTAAGSSSLYTALKTTLTGQDHSNKDTPPAAGNTWKFTVSVAALAACTFTLILCAIKGPSWYKLFYNYRHRRLHQEEDNDVVSTVFTETGRHVNHQTFTFDHHKGQIQGRGEEEGDEDGYFEDPYIRREE